MRWPSLLSLTSLAALPLLAFSVACNDGSDGTATGDGGAGGEGGSSGSSGDGGGAGTPDGGPTSCTGISCVDTFASVHTAIAIDGTNHPIVAYNANDTIKVRRWNDTAWVDLGTPRANRESLPLSTFQLHVIKGKPTLVSSEKNGAGVHIEQFDTEWADVAGSPIKITGDSGSVHPLGVHSASRNDVLHAVIWFEDTVDPFHVRKFDGTAITLETDATGVAGTHADVSHIGVAPDGSIAVAYNGFITKNVTGGTTWTLGATKATGFESSASYPLLWTNTGGILFQNVGGTQNPKTFATKGDGVGAFTRLGPNDGVIDGAATLLGYPDAMFDATDRPCVAMPIYSDTNKIAMRLKCYDGASWVTVVDGVKTSSPIFGPVFAAAAIKGNLFAHAGGRRFDGVGTLEQYTFYEQINLP